MHSFVCFRAQETFLQWDQCRRFYNFLMADNMKKIILSHRYCWSRPQRWIWQTCVSAWLWDSLFCRNRFTRVFFCNQAIRRILENMNLNTELSVKRCIFCFYRGVLFGGGSTKMVDADLSRLYTATSLMQIDDNIMRWVLGNCYMWFLSFSWETDTRRICDLRFVIDHTVNK